jgi:hypothetical protein
MLSAAMPQEPMRTHASPARSIASRRCDISCCAVPELRILVLAVVPVGGLLGSAEVAADVRRRANQLPENSGPRALVDVVLRAAEARLTATLEGTVHWNRARLIRALYERLDRLEAARPAAGCTHRAEELARDERNAPSSAPPAA